MGGSTLDENRVGLESMFFSRKLVFPIGMFVRCERVWAFKAQYLQTSLKCEILSAGNRMSAFRRTFSGFPRPFNVLETFVRHSTEQELQNAEVFIR